MADENEVIWLQPWCGDCALRSWEAQGEGRMWCQDNPWDDCEDCGAKPVKYVLAGKKKK